MPYRTGSKPSCSTNGSTVSPLGPGYSWLLACLGRSCLQMLLQTKKPEKLYILHLIHSGHCSNTFTSSVFPPEIRVNAQTLTLLCFCTWGWTGLDFTALSGFWLEGRVTAVAPGYQLLPLVTLYFSNLDTSPTGLTALWAKERDFSLYIVDA